MLKKKICAFLLMVGIILSLSSFVLSAALDCEFYFGSTGWCLVEENEPRRIAVEIWQYTYDTRVGTGTLPSILADAGGYMNYAAISEHQYSDCDWWDCIEWIEDVGSRSMTNPGAATVISTACPNDEYDTDCGIAY